MKACVYRALVVLALVGAAGRASAQVVFDAAGTDCMGNGVAGATGKTCATLTVGPGANRVLVAMLVLQTTGTAPVLHWDSTGTNQLMTAITGATATNGISVWLFGLVAPTSGAKTLLATWTGTSDVYLEALSYTGADQTGGATTFPNGAGNTGTSTSSSVTVTSATNDAVVAVHGTGTDSFTVTNQTQLWVDNVATNISGAGNRAAGGASVSMTATKQASTTWASAGTSIHAAGGGGGPTCAPTLTLLGVSSC